MRILMPSQEAAYAPGGRRGCLERTKLNSYSNTNFKPKNHEARNHGDDIYGIQFQ
jgi:hypothetical protein